MGRATEMGRIMITGGNAGIGAAAARLLVADGHRVVVVARNQERGEKAIEEIKSATGGDTVELLICDLSSLTSVRKASAEALDRFPDLQVLINNAAISAWGRGRTETADGLEGMFGVNYVGPWLLTTSLLGRMLENAPARLVNIGARQMGARLDFDDLQLRKGWSENKATLNAKLGVFCATLELANRYPPAELTANLIDPGLVNTGYHAAAGFPLQIALRLFGKSVDEVARSYVELATSPQYAEISGKLFSGGKEKAIKGDPTDPALTKRVWEETERLVGT